jgi:hypothetical protein
LMVFLSPAIFSPYPSQIIIFSHPPI